MVVFNGPTQGAKLYSQNSPLCVCHSDELLFFSCSVMLNSWRPHGQQHARLLCPSPSPGVCHPTLSSSAEPLLLPSVFPSIIIFSSKLALHIRWPKYCNVSVSIPMNIPSNEYSGLISFKIDWIDLLAVQGTLRVFSSTTIQKHQFFGAQPPLWSSSHICT